MCASCYWAGDVCVVLLGGRRLFEQWSKCYWAGDVCVMLLGGRRLFELWFELSATGRVHTHKHVSQPQKTSHSFR